MGTQYGGDSPISASVNEGKGVYFCHVCHTSGEKLDFVQRATGTGRNGFMHGGPIAMHSEPALSEDEIAELTERLRQP